MNSLQRHTTATGRQSSLRNALNTLEGSHQRATPSVYDDSSALTSQPSRGLGRENDTTDHAESLHDAEFPHVMSTTTAEACSSTGPPASAYLSLRQYSDYVVMVPTPRTSSPSPDRPPNSGRPTTDASETVEREPGSGKVEGDDNGRVGSRSRAGLQLQKTVGRLKRYLGLAAACGTSSESRNGDDVSCAGDEPGPPLADRELTEAIDMNGLASRRSHSDSDSPRETAVRQDPTRIYGIHRNQPQQYRSSVRGELGPGRRHGAAAASGTESRRRDGAVTGRVKMSVDDMALETVVPGVRVRVPPRRQLSQHERPLTDPDHVVAATQTGSWLDDARARSQANVERWLCRNRETGSGRSSRHDHHDRGGASHARLRRRASETPDAPPTMDRSVSETDVRRAAAVDHFRSRDQHQMTSRPATPSVAGSTGAEGESNLGPSLVQLVAEIIEGLEQRSRDDSSAIWSGIRGTATPASKLFQQITTRAMNADLAARRCIGLPVDDGAPEDATGRKGSGSSSGDTLTPREKSRTSALLPGPEKTLTGRVENVDEAEATGCSEWPNERKSTGAVASCSVAVLRQRLLRAVEGDSSQRAVTHRLLQRRRTASKDGETATRHSVTSALVSCGAGTHARTHLHGK